MPLCQIFQLAQKNIPASQHQFLDDIFNFHLLKIGAGWLVNGFVQARIFGKVGFIIIFMVYFNILKS